MLLGNVQGLALHSVVGLVNRAFIALQEASNRIPIPVVISHFIVPWAPLGVYFYPLRIIHYPKMT